jgi:hypothetical protein
MNIGGEELFRKALTKWGNQSQVFMLFEEMAELQKSMCKLDRKYNGGTVEQVTQEMADVYIMLAQMRVMLNVPEEYIEQKIRDKLERLSELLEK